MDDWNWKAILFSIDGRINRAKFWLATILVNLVGGFAMQLSIGLIESSGGMNDPVHWIGVVTTLALVALTFWIGLAINVKRLHDRGKAGWWLLVFYLPLLAAGMLRSALPSLGGLTLLGIIVLAGWATVEFGFLKETTGPNAYGPDPIPEEADQPL